MKFTFLLISFGYVVTAIPSPSLPVHPGVGGLYKGPNSETIIKGPDGSVITAAAEGGEIRTKLEPIVVEEPEVVAEVKPIIPEVKPVIAETVEVVPEPVKLLRNTEITGPSGLISTNGIHSVIAGPASTTITGPAVVAETVVKGNPIIGAAPFAVSPHLPVASASISSELSVASASISGHGSVATVTVSPNIAIAAAGDSERVVVAKANIVPTDPIIVQPNIEPLVPPPITALPILASTLTNLVEPNIGTGYDQNLHSVVGINDHIDFDAKIAQEADIIPKSGHFLGLRLNSDQIFSDNKQIYLNPNSIPSQNIIPPEIRLKPILEGGIDEKLLNFEHSGTVQSDHQTPTHFINSLENIQRGEKEPSVSNYVTVTEKTAPISYSTVSTISPNIQREESISEETVVNTDINGDHHQLELSQQNQVLLENNIRSPQHLFQPVQLINVTPKNRVHLTQVTESNNIPIPEALSAVNPQSADLFSRTESYAQSLPVQYSGLAQSGHLPQSSFLEYNGLPQSGNVVQSHAVPQTSGFLHSGYLAQSGAVPHSGALAQSENLPQSANFPQSAVVPHSVTLNKEQPILSAALAKSGIDVSQINLANIPLSAVSPLASPVNVGKLGEGWDRYARDVKDLKVVEKL